MGFPQPHWFVHDFALQFWIDDFEGHFGVIMKVVTQNECKILRLFSLVGSLIWKGEKINGH
jgi:hypothetical protein